MRELSSSMPQGFSFASELPITLCRDLSALDDLLISSLTSMAAEAGVARLTVLSPQNAAGGCASNRNVVVGAIARNAQEAVGQGAVGSQLARF